MFYILVYVYMCLINTYFDLQAEYERKFPNTKIVILSEEGLFYTLYGIDNNVEKVGDLANVTSLLNIQLSRKDKSILQNDRNNPQMAGFPSKNVDKYIQLLLNN